MAHVSCEVEPFEGWKPECTAIAAPYEILVSCEVEPFEGWKRSASPPAGGQRTSRQLRGRTL